MPKQRAKKRVSVLATSTLMTKISKKASRKIKERFELQQIPSIYYPARLREFYVEALINFGSKVNAIQLRFVIEIGFRF